MRENTVTAWVICLLVAGSLMGCGTQEIRTGNLNVIRCRGSYRNSVGGTFRHQLFHTICYEKGNEKLASTARLLAGYIKEVTGTEVKIGTKAGKNCIILKSRSVHHAQRRL